MTKHDKNGVKTLSLRLPQSVAKAVAKRAKSENRSLNAQIVHEISGDFIIKWNPKPIEA
jgi:hypothetical protein